MDIFLFLVFVLILFVVLIVLRLFLQQIAIGLFKLAYWIVDSVVYVVLFPFRWMYKIVFERDRDIEIQDYVDEVVIEKQIEYPYKSMNYVFSMAEYSFYKVLKEALKNDHVEIFPKMRIADMIYVDTKSKYMSHFQKISQKHVDYLLCKSIDCKPLCAIELDDSTHGKADRRKRDEFVDSVFKSSNLPLVRFKCNSSYNIESIRDELKQYI